MLSLVSVIVPAYNAESYIEDCLLSITVQSYKNIEVIVVDDGSTDSTYDICSRVARDDNRITVVRQENTGVSGARNRAIDVARGGFLSFVDADDLLAENALELLVGSLTNGNDGSSCNKSDVAIMKMRKVYDARIDLSLESGVSEVSQVKPKEVIDRMLYDRLECGLPAKIFSRKLFEDNRLDVSLKYAEDLDFIYRLLSSASLVSIVEHVGYLYRQHEDSAVHAEFSSKRFQPVEVCNRILLKEMSAAARHRLFMEAVNNFLRLPSSKLADPECSAKFWSVVVKYRAGVLFDAKSRLRNKVYAVLSYGGANMLHRLYKTIIGRKYAI